MNRVKMTKIVDRVRYDTEKATLIADDVYWDGHNMERGSTNRWLYRTKKGNYFLVRGTFWQGEFDSLTPVDKEQALELYEGPLKEHYLEYEAAFPGVEIEEA